LLQDQHFILKMSYYMKMWNCESEATDSTRFVPRSGFEFSSWVENVYPAIPYKCPYNTW